jgi:predicted permease
MLPLLLELAPCLLGGLALGRSHQPGGSAAQRRPAQRQQLGAVVGNTAYFGLPVALALLPPEAPSFSITADFVGTLVTWGLGPLLLDGQRPMLVLNTPVVRAVLVAVPLLASPRHAALAAAALVSCLTLGWPAPLRDAVGAAGRSTHGEVGAVAGGSQPLLQPTVAM